MKADPIDLTLEWMSDEELDEIQRLYRRIADLTLKYRYSVGNVDFPYTDQEVLRVSAVVEICPKGDE